SEKELQGILNALGLKVKYDLHVSYGGKGSGKMWEKLSKIYQISKHTGDSQHADVNMARKFGVNGVHFNPGYTQMENFLREKRMENLSLVSRYLRLSNPYDKKEVKNYLWDLEAQFNIPLLLLYSEYLHIYCQKH